MADKRRDEKTEAPTPRQRKKLRGEGQVARSQDVSSMIALIGLFVSLRFLVPVMGTRLGSFTRTILSSLADTPDQSMLQDLVLPVTIAVLAPPMFIAAGFALVAGFAQTGFKISPKALKPKFSRLSPKQGIEKFKPAKMMFELMRVLAKAFLLIAVLYFPLRNVLADTPGRGGLSEWVSFANGAILSVLLWAAGLVTVIGLLDYAYNKRKLVKDSKMTRQQVRDEYKDSEGDAKTKANRKSKARELSRNRMMTEVGSADVLLVNPIRFAVALRYVESQGAPRVVARGAGKVALRLRKEAYRNGVPVRQDIPLTRALYRRCRVGQFVPSELYEAVAVILAAVYRRRALRRVAA
jgi:flagellar biosynthesis protein FlhB